MKKLTSKIMNANFKKLWIRWLVICLCAALVGGGISAAHPGSVKDGQPQ